MITYTLTVHYTGGDQRFIDLNCDEMYDLWTIGEMLGINITWHAVRIY
jgi:hypothetical protein